MNILKELKREIEQCENVDSTDVSSQNRISILKSILKIKTDNEKGLAYKKMLYLLLVKICIVLIELQNEEVVTFDLEDLDLIANKIGNPNTSVEDLLNVIEYLLEDRFSDVYTILTLRDELIRLIYERLILEKA
ncbi:MAG: hypothetical protein WD491_02540 [Balneolales bacterium]